MAGLLYPYLLLTLIVIIVIYFICGIRGKDWLIKAGLSGMITSTLFYLPIFIIVTSEAETTWTVVEEKPIKITKKHENGFTYELDDAAKEKSSFVYYHTTDGKEGKVVISRKVFVDDFIDKWFDPPSNKKYDVYLPKE